MLLSGSMMGTFEVCRPRKGGESIIGCVDRCRTYPASGYVEAVLMALPDTLTVIETWPTRVAVRPAPGMYVAPPWALDLWAVRRVFAEGAVCAGVQAETTNSGGAR